MYCTQNIILLGQQTYACTLLTWFNACQHRLCDKSLIKYEKTSLMNFPRRDIHHTTAKVGDTCIELQPFKMILDLF